MTDRAEAGVKTYFVLLPVSLHVQRRFWGPGASSGHFPPFPSIFLHFPPFSSITQARARVLHPYPVRVCPRPVICPDMGARKGIDMGRSRHLSDLLRLTSLGVLIWIVASLLSISVPGSMAGRRAVVELIPHLESTLNTPVTSIGEWTDQNDHPPTELAMAVAVLTEPDVGPSGATQRFAGPVVHYRLELESMPDWYRAEVYTVLAWVARQTGLTITETTGTADLVVSRKNGNGAHAQVVGDGHGTILSAHVWLGCCWRRAAWEDLAQAFGPLGDRADNRSVFSQSSDQLRGSGFDAWVLHELYQLPPGTNAGTLSAYLTTL